MSAPVFRSMARRALVGLASAALASLAMAAGAAAATNPSGSRTYELVPPNDGGGYANDFLSATADGERVLWGTSGDPAGIQPDGGVGAYLNDLLGTSRLASGWVSEWMNPSPTTYRRDDNLERVKASADGSRVLYKTSDRAVPEDTDDVFDLYIGSADGVRLVTPGTSTNITLSVMSPAFIAASDDLSTVVTMTTEALLPSDTDTRRDLYAWTDSGVEHWSLDETGADPGASDAAFGSAEFPAITNNALSADASKLFFTSADQLVAADTDAFADLYVRIATPAGPELRRLTAAGATTEFVTATPDGKYAFVRTSAALVPEDTDGGRDYYRVTVSDGSIEFVSGNGTAGTASQDGQLVNVSNDGSHAMFVTEGAVLPADTDGGRSLYMWSDAGTVSYLSPMLGNRSSGDYGSGAYHFGLNPSGITRDGGVAVFRTAAPATLDDTDGQPDVFVYRDGAVSKVSEGPIGGNGATPAELGSRIDPFAEGTRDLIAGGGGGEFGGRMITADGSRIYFTTAEALVAHDVNDAVDVYEHGPDGVELISTGAIRADAVYYDNDMTGEDVFIGSNRPLDASMSGTPYIYDARAGGGFPVPPGAPDCDGDGCQGTAVSRPRAGAPGSTVLDGAGNADRGPRASFLVKRMSKAQRARLARGRAVGLRVRTSVPGRIRVVVRAKVGKRRVVVARGSRVARRAGAVRVRLRLSKAGRRSLAAKQRLRLSLAIRVSGVAERKTQTLRLTKSTGGRHAR